MSEIRHLKKFFILGCPRSGTTLLQQALNRHSQITIPPETRFFYSLHGHSHRNQIRHVESLNADLGIKLPIPARRIESACQARAFYNHMAALYLERLGRSGVAYFGEKSPEHSGHWRRVHRIFPDASLIWIYRDGRDVALSLAKMPWGHPSPCVGLIVWLYYYYALRIACRKSGAKIHLVKYEDLVTNPARELGRITDELGLAYEPAMAEGTGNREGIPEREYAWKARAWGPISADRVGVWQRELSATQVCHLECLGGHALRDLGYNLASKRGQAPGTMFVPKLCWDLLVFLSRQPWHLLVHEIRDYAYSMVVN